MADPTNVKVPGYTCLSPGSLRFRMVFQAGFHRQKRLWVLGYLKQSYQENLEEGLCVARSPSILFGLAAFFLCRGFLSTMEQAKICFGTLLCRILGGAQVRHLKNKVLKVFSFFIHS
jgi:hypothetical protein